MADSAPDAPLLKRLEDALARQRNEIILKQSVLYELTEQEGSLRAQREDGERVLLAMRSRYGAIQAAITETKRGDPPAKAPDPIPADAPAAAPDPTPADPPASLPAAADSQAAGG